MSAGKVDVFEQFAQVGKALSHSTRLELIDLLVQGERPVEALANATATGLSTCSAHLQALKHAKLVMTRRSGTKIFYRLAGDDVAALYALVQQVAAAHRPEVAPARLAWLGPSDTEAVTREDLLERVMRGEVTVIDVRPADEYDAAHIPGAVGLPLSQLVERLNELPRGTEIVAYCRGEFCAMSHDAVRLLTRHGFHARRLLDGMLEWRVAGLPTATSTELHPADVEAEAS